MSQIHSYWREVVNASVSSRATLFTAYHSPQAIALLFHALPDVYPPYPEVAFESGPPGGCFQTVDPDHSA